MRAQIKLCKRLHETLVNIVDDYRIELEGECYDLKELSLAPPVSGTIYGTLLNYKGNLQTMGNKLYEKPYNNPPNAPVLYIKPQNTLTGYGSPIPLPKDVSGLEIGAALGIVIGRTATQVSREQALEYVKGYTVVNDVSIPHKSVHRPAIKEKVRDGFCPVGPWIIDQDEVTNPDNLKIRVYINGKLRQENTTANLVRSVATLIEDVTEFMTLNIGDILLVGVPENAPVAKAGDEVRIEIDEIGMLENTVIPENKVERGSLS